MSDREGERKKDSEDLFGDLGEYFAPIDDVPWPEGEAPAAADEAARDESARDEAAEDEAAGGEEPGGGQGGEEASGVTAEMSGDEWDRLREALAEEDQPAAPPEEDLEGAPPGAEPAAPGPPASEGESEVTLEELEEMPIEGEDQAEAPEGEEAPMEEPEEDHGSWTEEEDHGSRAEEEEEEEEAEVPEAEEPFVAEEPVLAGEAVVVGAAASSEEEEAEEAIAPDGMEDEGLEPADTEAAAEHFAAGLSPDEVERELLSDLEGGEGAEEPAETEAVAPETEVLEGEAPTWREAAPDVEEGGEGPPPPTTPGRNIAAAAASAIILAGAAVALLAIGKGFFAVLAGIVVLVGQGEFYAVVEGRGFKPATALGLIAGAFIMAGAYIKGRDGVGEAAMLVGLVLGSALSFLWYMAAPPSARKNTTANLGLTVLGMLWIPFLVSFGLLLLAVPGDNGRNFVVVVVGLTILYDLSAYAIGSLWGNRPLAPTISPQKSWEGAIGATFVLLLVALALVPSIDPFDASKAAGLALVIAVAAPLGDLAESVVKRDLGVKDMGTILPGHGGVMDRIDAILFAAPAAYYYLRLVF